MMMGQKSNGSFESISNIVAGKKHCHLLSYDKKL